MILSGLVVRKNDALSGSVQASRSRKRWRREQVAAVCFRWQRGAIEFLLVRTRGGRWTFPKGGTERGLTHAQAAAMEAFEEAGVHGCIEELPFTYYLHRKRDKAQPSGQCRLRVRAHLCEVLRLSRPQESGRTPTWFSADRAKQFLRKDRTAEYAAEFARVVDHAAARIRRLQSAATRRIDALQKIPFEASEHPRGSQRWSGQIVNTTPRAALTSRTDSYLPEILRLGNGEADAASLNEASSAADKMQIIEFHQLPRPGRRRQR